MTRYTVIWAPDVEYAFSEYWLAGGSLERRFLTELANRIDHDLSASPDLRGQPMAEDDTRRLLEFSLFGAEVAVGYRVIMDDRIVNVLWITAK